MQIVFEQGRGWRELELRVHNPEATVADLAVALVPGSSGRRGLVIDGRLATPDLGLSECGLRQAAVVRLPDQAVTTPRRANEAPERGPVPAGDGGRGVAELVVVGGLDAGARFALAPGDAVIGRGSAAAVSLTDPTVSSEHVRIAVSLDGSGVLTDLGSRNGTLLGGTLLTAPVEMGPATIVSVGATQVELQDLRRDDRPDAPEPHRRGSVAGTVPFNRPPRPAPPPAAVPLPVPEPPRPAGGANPVGVASVLAPIAFSVVMVAVTGSFTYALFSLLSPVMILANAHETRRRGRRVARRDQARFDQDLARFALDAAAMAHRERERRRREVPDVAEMLRRAMRPSTRLWERRPNHRDVLRLGVGIGRVTWSPAFDLSGWHRGAARPDKLASIMAAAATLPDCPVTAELAQGGVVGVVGDRAAALAVARSLLCQAAAQTGPADLVVAVLAAPDHGSAWDWSKWLPHARDTGGGRLLSKDPERSSEIAEALLRAARDGRDAARFPGPDRPGPVILAVVDDEALTEGRKAPVRALLRGDAGPVAGIAVATVAERLPAMYNTVLTLDGPLGEASLERPQTSERVEPFLATGLAERTARAFARALSRFEDPELDVVGAGLPDTLRLLPLLELGVLEPAAVAARWSQAGARPRVAAPIGVSEDGLFEIDLDRDGPHGLVAGTTGAGKSELLRALVAGLAATVSPDHLTFMLVDFKGGSAFDECARLPHTVGLVTDLDESLAERALRCLHAEVRHRERLLREAAAADLEAYLSKGAPLGPLPRLVVVIDEFATLRAELPDFVDALVSVAQRGRSLGVHLVLATQRPSGAVSENIRANTNLRVALRVQDGRDSTDVIDVPDAARIPRSAPGRAYVRLGAGEIVTIQTALSTAAGGTTATAPVEVVPFTFDPSSTSGVDGAERTGSARPTNDLAALVNCIRDAFWAAPRRAGPGPTPYLWWSSSMR